VEWKRVPWPFGRQARLYLGNFLSGMETRTGTFGSAEVVPLETSLVEWKRGNRDDVALRRVFLGNFLSGMETRDAMLAKHFCDRPWKLP